MKELFVGALPFVLLGLLPTLALLHGALLGRRGRTSWALLLAVIAVGFLVDLAVVDHSGDSTLQVKNPFPRGAEAQPFPWVVDEVTAPVWQWHVVVSIWFGLTAAYVWLTRNRAPAPPRPIPIVVIAAVCSLAARLLLEKTAAPEGIVWATGVNWTLLAMAPFFGWYCGLRGLRFGRWALALLAANALARAVVVAVAFFATTRGLGTHLDVHAVTEITPPVGEPMTFTDPTEQWKHLVLVPQLVFLAVAGTVTGLLLGAMPWRLARRRAAPPGP